MLSCLECGIDFEHNTLARYKVKDEEGTDQNQDGDGGGSSNAKNKTDAAEEMEKPLLARIIDRFSKYDEKFERALPGESTVKTRLYSVLWTPQRQLGECPLLVDCTTSCTTCKATDETISFRSTVLSLNRSFRKRTHIHLNFHQIGDFGIGKYFCTGCDLPTYAESTS